MSQAYNKWGIELDGPERDQKVWRILLKQPFDPSVQEIKDGRGDYLVLRSSAFNGIASSKEVHEAATQLFSTLNVAMAMNADTDPISKGPVIEFVSDGQPRKHHHLDVEAGTLRVRGEIATITLSDAQGNVIEPPQVPSKTQLWMRAATLDSAIGSALRYLEGKPDWIALYKAYEAIRGLPNGGISNNEISRFTQSANHEQRHHNSDGFRPPNRPMDLWEARALIARWIAAAIDDILAKNP